MKKIFTLLAIVAIAIAMPSCGGGEKKGATVEAKAAQFAKELFEATKSLDFAKAGKIEEQMDQYCETLSDADEEKFEAAFEKEVLKLMGLGGEECDKNCANCPNAATCPNATKSALDKGMEMATDAFAAGTQMATEAYDAGVKMATEAYDAGVKIATEAMDNAEVWAADAAAKAEKMAEDAAAKAEEMAAEAAAKAEKMAEDAAAAAANLAW